MINLTRLQFSITGEPDLNQLEDLEGTAFQVHSKWLAAIESRRARQQHLNDKTIDI
jgi:hypothetical protein